MTKREQLIKKAFEYLSTHKNNIVNKDEKIPSTTKGYIASLGGSIVQAGLQQTVIFFEDSGEGREDIIKAIVWILAEHKPHRYKDSTNKDMDFSQVNRLGKHLTTITWHRRQLTNDFVEAAVALKMAMRLYPSD